MTESASDLPAWKLGSKERYLLARRFSETAVDTLLGLYFSDKGQCSILQVGANDGQTNDPLFKHMKGSASTALLIEPDPVCYAKLVSLHGENPRVSTLNVAIAPEGQKAKFFAPRHDMQDQTVGYLPLLGSFRWSAIHDHVSDIPEIERFFEAIEVETSTLAEVIERHCPSPNLICIDTEGYDAKVLLSGGLLPTSVNLILYERKFLEPAEESQLLQMLASQQFSHLNLHPNAMAYRGLGCFDRLGSLLTGLNSYFMDALNPPTDAAASRFDRVDYQSGIQDHR